MDPYGIKEIVFEFDTGEEEIMQAQAARGVRLLRAVRGGKLPARGHQARHPRQRRLRGERCARHRIRNGDGNWELRREVLQDA